MSEQQVKRKILYIEDDPNIIEIGKLMLQNHGFEVIGAVGGTEGMEMIREVKPDLVLLDLMMPDLNGWDVYQRMRADVAFDGIPVIVVTARQEDIDKVLMVNVGGVDGYIKKPFDATTLLSRVRKALGDDADNDN